jgi:hypothetical protein
MARARAVHHDGRRPSADPSLRLHKHAFDLHTRGSKIENPIAKVEKNSPTGSDSRVRVTVTSASAGV